MRIFRSTLTSKGQITIQKELRKELGIETGDVVSFSLNEDGQVFFAKEKQMEACPVCFGLQVLHKEKYPCFLCAESGAVERYKWAWPSIQNAYKYSVNVTLTQQFWKDGESIVRNFPKVDLSSKFYPDHVLRSIQDTVQLELIQSSMPNEDGKFIYPHLVDEVLEIILAFFKDEWAKIEFRHRVRPEEYPNSKWNVFIPRLSGSAGTGDQILESPSWYFKVVPNETTSKEEDDYYVYKVSFGGRTGFMNYRFENGEIVDVNLDIIGFAKTLDAKIDPSLLRLARKVHEKVRKYKKP